MSEPTKVVAKLLTANTAITGEARLSYSNVLEPRKNPLSGKVEYSAVVLIPKSDTKSEQVLKQAAKAAAESKWGSNIPKLSREFLRDGDEAEQESYKGHWFFNAKSDKKIPVIDARREAITDPDDIKSGDYARVKLRAYAYDQMGNKGVSFGLQAVQKLRNGEALGSTNNADGLDAVEVETEAENEWD